MMDGDLLGSSELDELLKTFADVDRSAVNVDSGDSSTDRSFCSDTSGKKVIDSRDTSYYKKTGTVLPAGTLLRVCSSDMLIYCGCGVSSSLDSRGILRCGHLPPVKRIY